MCRDPAGPMSSDGELGLGPLPAVTAAAPEVTPVRIWNTVSLRRALHCFVLFFEQVSFAFYNVAVSGYAG